MPPNGFFWLEDDIKRQTGSSLSAPAPMEEGSAPEPRDLPAQEGGGCRAS